MIRRNLLDLNVLIALADQRHDHNRAAASWYATEGKYNWGLCPFTEAGFLRVTTNQTYRPGPNTFERAIEILHSVKRLPGYCHWEIKESWVDLTAPFASRISGHQQITDAYLLGLAIKHDGVLVAFDRGLKYLAGPQFTRNLLILE